MQVLKLSRVVTVVLLFAAFMLDALGRVFERPFLWEGGAHLMSAGVGLGLLVWIAAWFVSSRGQVSALLSLVCCALARFLRGSAGVPPDTPLVVLAGLGALLMAWSWWRWKRATLLQQSRAAAQPPA